MYSEVSRLRNLSVEMQKYNLTTEDALHGIRIEKAFDKLGVATDQHIKLIQVCKKINDPGLKMAPHLHITAGWISEDLDYEKLDWETISNSNMIILVDPLDTIDIDSGTLEDYPPECSDL